jgi:integrase
MLAATAENSRGHLIYSLDLGTGLRLAEIVGLNVGDIYAPDGTPRSRVRIRAEIAKGGRTGDIFLPDKLGGKLRKSLGAQDPLVVRGSFPWTPSGTSVSASGSRIIAQRTSFATMWRNWPASSSF